MRIKAIVMSLLLVGCAPGVSTIKVTSDNLDNPPKGGMPYYLPKGLVPISVFADENGIGLTIEPAQLVGDGKAGMLLAKLNPSPFNNEDFKLGVDPSTGLLSTVSTDSEAQLLAIAEEAAKSVGRLALQNARATFLNTKVVVLQDSFDPLSLADVKRINVAIEDAIYHTERAFPLEGKSRSSTKPKVKVTIYHVDGTQTDGTQAGGTQAGGTQAGGTQAGGTQAGGTQAGGTQACEIGVCTRAMTSRVIRVEIDGKSAGSKLVAVPESQVIPVPVPQTVLANQKIAITMKDGILKQYDVDRDSELLGLVKLPGAVAGGLVAGITQQLTDKKTIVDKRKELADSETALANAKKESTTALKLENDTAGGTGSSYAAQTLTIYLHSEALAGAIRQRIDASKKEKKTPGANKGDGDLLRDNKGQSPVIDQNGDLPKKD